MISIAFYDTTGQVCYSKFPLQVRVRTRANRGMPSFLGTTAMPSAPPRGKQKSTGGMAMRLGTLETPERITAYIVEKKVENFG